MATTTDFKELVEAAKTISGPHYMFDDSFTIEFLEPPPSLNATTLFRATYLWSHPSTRLGKAHPQCPPLHMHFDQSETLFCASGKVGTTLTYGYKDHVWTREDGTYEIKPWVPHTFWPHPEAGEDTVVYVWAHPDGVKEPMDWLFFKNLLGVVSDMSDGKPWTTGMGGLSTLTQVMVTQHASATAVVIFPRAWWLGPLRWWVPWTLQGGIAAIGRTLGYRALMEKYTPKEEWQTYLHAKRT